MIIVQNSIDRSVMPELACALVGVLKIRRLAVLGLIVCLLAGAAVAGVLVLRSHQAPAAFALSTPSESTGTAPLAGVWRVAAGSEAGYRARERFINQPATTEAVARTDKVTGSVKITAQGASYTAKDVDIKVDLGALVSQDKYANYQAYQRDFFVRTIYLQTNVYPTAEFKAANVSVRADQAPGPVELSVPGTLSAHGVTKPAKADMKVQLTGDRLEVVGTINVDMRDFNVEVPAISFTTAEPILVVEYHLLLARG